MDKVRKALIQKDPVNCTQVSNYRPILCLGETILGWENFHTYGEKWISANKQKKDTENDHEGQKPNYSYTKYL